MTLSNASMPNKDFNPNKDKIALMLKAFTILSKDAGLGKKNRLYSEPYFVGLSLSESVFSAHQINFDSNRSLTTR
jgi:hypothetical protein